MKATLSQVVVPILINIIVDYAESSYLSEMGKKNIRN